MSKKILIADDEPNILISLEFLMKREGYEVLLARDGQEAMDVLLRERPALVLLDVMMPIKSGFDVCCEVRASDVLRDTPIRPCGSCANILPAPDENLPCH